MALGEIFHASFLELLLDRMASRDLVNYRSEEGIHKKLQIWRRALYGIGAVLNDAEEKQLTSKAVELWLDDLRDLAYDLEDLLDKFFTEMLERKAKEQNRPRKSKVRSLFPKVRLFHLSMNSEIEDITCRLQEISERKDKLGLKYTGTASIHKAWKRPPSSYVLSGAPVVGRDNDKEKIIELLSRDGPSTVNFQVVAIVGMPGVGKTTLAQLVLNENGGVMEQFNLKVWIFVSDEFNLVRVTKAILESVTSQPCHLEEFNSIHEKLRKELAGKKFLLILDDVWNTCDYDLWEKLQSPFRHGAFGSKIVVTTRDAKVARTMGASEVYNLECISDHHCWKVFEQHALNVNDSMQPNFGLFREKIVARCSGLPLAAMTLGGLLGCKDSDEWQEILNNKLWSEESDIVPVLKLSYYYLPSNMKRCFAYCSIIPNGYEFGEMQLILLWMAEGLLQQPEAKKGMEDIGGDYFGELLSRSLFQKSRKSNSMYVMHDLVCDLARWAAGEMFFRLEDKPDDGSSCSASTRHLSYISGNYDGIKKFEAICEVKCAKLEAFSEVKRLRTFLPLTISPNPQNYLTSIVTLDLVPSLLSLRVLSLNGYQITELPNSIGKLKYLRYLDLSHTLIMFLPDSVSTLCNLQTLILENCSKLKALPANMRNLTNLRHLKNSNVPSLERMPTQLSKLTNLQTLHNFVVGEGNESRVREVGPLLLLRGTLRLSRLENIVDAEDARHADLIGKEGLDAVELEWSRPRTNESVVLNMLHPHNKLKELTIKGYRGFQFSTWIGDKLFSNMVIVRLENCNYCRWLPPLGQLPSLNELFVRGMTSVESVGVEFYGHGSASFPKLEILKFEDMQSWKEWLPCEIDEGIGVFPSLKMLSIKGCPKLEGTLPEILDSLRELTIHGCGEMVVSIANYKCLCDLSVYDCKGVVYASTVDFEFLKNIVLSYCREFILQTEGFMTNLRSVESLAVYNYVEFRSSWMNVDRLLQHLISLRNLLIVENPNLLQLCHLTSLQYLSLYKCPCIDSFPEASLPPSLLDIRIECCDSLTYFVKCQIPPSLRRIEIRKCKKLRLLVEGVEEVEATGSSSSLTSYSSSQEEASCLDYLSIFECPSITCLSFRGQLPRTLKFLYIDFCGQLESITNSWQNNTCLEVIMINYCDNLKSLPEGLCHLTNLQVFQISYCWSLVSFPKGGFPAGASNLTHISIYQCNNLEALPQGMDKHNLNSLQVLEIGYCDSLESGLEEGYPNNLTQICMADPKICKPPSDWGLHLHQLNSLKDLFLDRVDPCLVSFPLEQMLLPRSLIEIDIHGFQNLEKLSKGFLSLNSLQSLKLGNCPKLASIPEKGLPLSLTQLRIVNCPVLEDQCKPVPRKGRYWPILAHIPYVEIGDWKITDKLT